MAELADEIFVAYTLPGGNIEKLITDVSCTGKKFHVCKQGERLRLYSMYDKCNQGIF